MKYSRRYRETDDEDAQIDISPLIDVVFILVIFFVVTTVFNKPIGVDINKPPKVESSKKLDSSSVMIGLTDSGQVMYGGKNIGMDGIQAVIESVRDGGDPIPVIVVCDANANAESITKIVNQATLAEAKSVSIATQK